MESDNKVPNNIYKTYGELFSANTSTNSSEQLNSTSMINKLQNVRSLNTLNDDLILKLLHDLEEL